MHSSRNNLTVTFFSKIAVSFLADLGGLYCISIGIFFCFLVQVCYSLPYLRCSITSSFVSFFPFFVLHSLKLVLLVLISVCYKASKLIPLISF